jgi:glycosyltransferase involved in cell wall biosynthesis
VPFLIAIIGRYILEPCWLREYRDVQIITVSQSSKESLQLYGLHNIDIVPEGFDFIHEFSQVQKQAEPTIIFVGRLTRNKRPDVAIAAYKLLKEQLPTAVLKIVGTGPLEKRIKRSAPDGVHFLGRLSQDEKNRHVSSAHALVATSVREGWGLVVTESAILGTVTVAYDVPGLRDSVRASNGYLSETNERSLSLKIFEVLSEYQNGEQKMAYPGGVVNWLEVSQKILHSVSNESIYLNSKLSQ